MWELEQIKENKVMGTGIRYHKDIGKKQWSRRMRMRVEEEGRERGENME